MTSSMQSVRHPTATNAISLYLGVCYVVFSFAAIVAKVVNVFCELLLAAVRGETTIDAAEEMLAEKRE